MRYKHLKRGLNMHELWPWILGVLILVAGNEVIKYHQPNHLEITNQRKMQ